MTIQDIGSVSFFWDEARAWFEENFPHDLRNDAARDHVSSCYPIYPSGGSFDLWKARVAAKGWGTPDWPVEYGGGGLDPQRAEIVWTLYEEFGAFNPMSGVGTWFLGDTLLSFGNEEQKREHLCRISRGEARWCQGFSEPGAGSDLAALTTSAIADGDDYVLNGQKTWTSEAQEAQWMFCLVRTDRAHKQKGLSFLVFPTNLAGIEIRPIRSIWGKSHFNEVFFTDVRVPKENMIGAPGQGWSIAKHLLQLERNPGRDRRRLPGDHRSLLEIARDYVPTDCNGVPSDEDLKSRMIEQEMAERRLELAKSDFAERDKAGIAPRAMFSVLKNTGAETVQSREELLLEILGHQALGWDGEAFSDRERELTRSFLHNKARTIYSGSTEIQLNLIASQALDLPRGG